MKDDQGNTPGTANRQEDTESREPVRRVWETPRILWTGTIQTLAYQCSTGPAPVSGSQTEGCPP